MKKLTNYLSEHIHTVQSDDSIKKAIFLIDNTGEMIEETGVIIRDKGIFHENGTRYPAAIGEDYKLYSMIDMNTISINLNKKFPIEE
jgi:hypothetical protein